MGAGVRASDVARLAGTSTATVSYVFNDGPRPVAEATRLRVLEAAKQLGYKPNALARALRTASSNLVGVMLPDVTTPYFSALAKDLEGYLARRGKLTLLTNTETGYATEANAFTTYESLRVDGLVVAYSDNPHPPPGIGDIPVSYIFNAPPGFSGPFIQADNQQAVWTAMDHLGFHGHRDIHLLGGPTELGPVGQRIASWRTHPGRGEGQLFRTAFSPGAAAQLLTGLIHEQRVPRALLVATDEQAIGLLAAASAHGLAVPGAMAVITLDGSPLTEFTAPALTATRQPTAPLAENAVKALLGEPHSREVAAELVIRATCGC